MGKQPIVTPAKKIVENMEIGCINGFMFIYLPHRSYYPNAYAAL
jgi:hypothetical protein